MRTHRFAPSAAALLVVLLAAPGCILIPRIVDRNVQMVVARVATVPLHATGATNTIAGANSVDLRDSVNFRQVVEDAGIDVSEIDRIVVSKIEYRVVVADPTAGRQITNADLKVSAGGGALTDLIPSFSHRADATTPWIRADVAAPGVAEINAMFAAIVAEVKGGPAADESVAYSISGTSAPTTPATNFWYEIRVTFQIAGRIRTKVLT